MNMKHTALRRLRGVILYELQATLATYARRKFSAGEISTDHMKNVMKVHSQNHFNNLSVPKFSHMKKKKRVECVMWFISMHWFHICILKLRKSQQSHKHLDSMH